MKQLIPQDETSQGNLAQTPSDSSTKFHSNQVPWIWILNQATQIMNGKSQDMCDKLPWKLLYCTPDSIKLRFHVRMGLHKSLMGLLMTGSNSTYRVRGQERAWQISSSTSQNLIERTYHLIYVEGGYTWVNYIQSHSKYDQDRSNRENKKEQIWKQKPGNKVSTQIDRCWWCCPLFFNLTLEGGATTNCFTLMLQRGTRKWKCTKCSPEM